MTTHPIAAYIIDLNLTDAQKDALAKMIGRYGDSRFKEGEMHGFKSGAGTLHESRPESQIRYEVVAIVDTYKGYMKSSSTIG